jgi:hypothetical protein
MQQVLVDVIECHQQQRQPLSASSVPLLSSSAGALLAGTRICASIASDIPTPEPVNVVSNSAPNFMALMIRMLFHAKQGTVAHHHRFPMACRACAAVRGTAACPGRSRPGRAANRSKRIALRSPGHSCQSARPILARWVGFCTGLWCGHRIQSTALPMPITAPNTKVAANVVVIGADLVRTRLL